MARGCALIDSRLDTAKIGSDGRVEVHRARLLAVFGGRKTFPHGLGQSRRFRDAPKESGPPPITDTFVGSVYSTMTSESILVSSLMSVWRCSSGRKHSIGHGGRGQPLTSESLYEKAEGRRL